MSNEGIRITTEFKTQHHEIAAILEEEANVLAHVIGDKKLVGMPTRVELATRREISRLRRLAAYITPEPSATEGE